MKILLTSNTAWSLVNFRSGLMRELIADGHDVVAVAPPDEYVPRINMLGVRFLPLPMDNRGTHPGRDALLLLRLVRVFRAERPNVVVNYTIKPVIYGSMAARYTGLPVVNVITGLGTVFLEENLTTKLVELLYRVSQSQVHKLFFLNHDDMRLFFTRHLAPGTRMECLPGGEGVDLSFFSPQDRTAAATERPFRFLLVARMLWDKGVGEYVGAARLVRRHFPETEFRLLGFLDVQNPAAISREQIADWVNEGIVSYLGVTADVRDAVAEADCVVLPSYYREGVPRSLLEAAAMARPIITADSVGCREAIDDEITGWLCKPRDAPDLAEKMLKMISLAPEERVAMGLRGRAKVECQFDERVVISRYRDVIGEIHERCST